MDGINLQFKFQLLNKLDNIVLGVISTYEEQRKADAAAVALNKKGISKAAAEEEAGKMDKGD